MRADASGHWAAGLCLTVLCVAGACRAEILPCPPPRYTRGDLEALAAKNFEMTDSAARNVLAASLVGCLANPDPTLRDLIAFEAFSHFMRAGELRDETMLALERTLLPWLDEADSSGFRRPFAALTLAELARVDRIKPYLPTDTRTHVLTAATNYFRSVSDYRGFDEHEGWRHGVAHGADLLLQLSLNPAFGHADVERILAALETQIAPRGQFYIFGEPGRLARPVIAIAGRGLLSEREWATWLSRVTAPSPWQDWRAAYGSRDGLARTHDVAAFVDALYVAVRLSTDRNVTTLLPGVEQAVRSLP